MIINTVSTNNVKLYEPTQDDMKYYDDKDGYLKLLIKDVISNGFEKDLYLRDDDEKKDFSILKVADNKMFHPRHLKIKSPLRRDHMMALIVYTGAECNYDLCKYQRKGDYEH